MQNARHSRTEDAQVEAGGHAQPEASTYEAGRVAGPHASARIPGQVAARGDPPRRPFALDEAAGDDTELNMTPMIDIVFQLIVFFLLSLKFKDVDERIDAQLPANRGPEPHPTPVDPIDKIKVKLFRVSAGQPHAFTRIRVGNRRDHTIDLPPDGERPGAADEASQRRATDARIARLKAILASRFEAMGRRPEIEAEIVAMPPTGRAVPHGHAMLVLDSLVATGIEKIVFEGVPEPRSR